MSEKRKDFIDQLLSDLKLLEERLLSVKESDTLPFSFFSASFDRIEKISRSLHELELMQIGEMKEQMERLVRFLSDRESVSVEEKPEIVEMSVEESVVEDPVTDEPIMEESITEEVVGEEIIVSQERTDVAERIIFPEYRNPRSEEASSLSGAVLPEKNGHEKPAARSLNDVIQAPPVLLDLKRGISLNDRFLFQRELFSNNREEMNSVMEKLNTLGSFDAVEDYLKDTQRWNFEDQTVKNFLLVIKKGFE